MRDRAFWLSAGMVVAAVALLQAAGPASDWVAQAYPLRGGLVARVSTIVFAVGAMTVAAWCSLGLWFAPAWLLARWLAPDEGPAPRTLRAFVLAFALQPLLHGAHALVLGPFVDAGRVAAIAQFTQGALIVAALYASRHIASSVRAAHDQTGRLSAVVGFTAALIGILLPRLFWQDLNPDGGELLTMGRTLRDHLVARLPTGEIPGVNLGMLTIAYPVHWLISIVGVGEAAVRLPATAYAVGIAAGVVALAELAPPRRLSRTQFVLLLAGVAAVCLTLAWNSSYDPYSTDLASPASIDLLALVFLLATFYFVFTGERRWIAGSAVLLALTRPSALMLAGLLVVAVLVVERDVRKARFRAASIALAAAAFVTVAYLGIGLSPLGDQIAEGGGNLLSRVRFLRFNDWQRVTFLLVPSGLLPAAGLLALRRQDRESRTLALVVLGYFAFFFVVAFTALHHFAPVMLLPLVVFWRGELQRGVPGVRRQGLIAAGIVVALVAALPRSPAVYRDARRIGASLAFTIGDYRGDADGVRQAFAAIPVLDSLFDPYSRVLDARQTRVGAPWTFVHYASLVRRRPEEAQYIVQAEREPAPAGTTLAGRAAGAAVYVRDVDRWMVERASPPPLDPRSVLYDLPRTTLFAHLGRQAGVPQLDLRQIADLVLAR